MKTSYNVFITGGASGIGFGIAEELAQSGHHVILADINEKAANEAATVLINKGLSASAIAVDVTNAQDAAMLPEALAETPVDILINNAGIQHVAKLEAFPAQKWQQLINIMLVGPALLCQTFLPGMKSRNFGRIINIGSIHSLVASPYKSAYVAAKHGLLGLAKTIALEVEQADITINTLCPAYVKTPLVEQQIADQAKANGISEEQVISDIMLKPMPKKAFISIEELAASTQFLISPGARNMTAQTLVLDGGWTAR